MLEPAMNHRATKSTYQRAAAVRRSDHLEGKTAIVAGAGSSGRGVGNGEAIATLLAMSGAKVASADIDERAGLATATSTTSA
jgi:S-adenosylhomocysteine hydrolase